MSDLVRLFRWSWSALSDAGRLRQVNEDAHVARLLPQSGLWAVADGMGGHSDGQAASKMVVEALETVHWHPRLDEFVAEVATSLRGANERLLAMAGSAGEARTIGSTVAALVCSRRQAACVWAGDSRIYRYRRGRLERLTRDHSEVEELIDQGALLREDADAHPSANVITRAVGVAPALELEMREYELQDGDKYLLCSDGLSKELSDVEIRAELSVGDSEQACRRLLDAALAAGGRDNVTVMVAQCHELE